METSMKLAIETYSNLSGESFENITTEILNGNETKRDIIMMLMFSTAL